MEEKKPASYPVTAENTPHTEKVAMPNEWPGAFGIYKVSRQAVMFNLSVFAVLFIATFILNGITTRYDSNLLVSIFSTLATFIISIAIILASYASIDSKKVSLGDVFSGSLNYLVKIVLLYFLLAIALFGSLLLFVIPFFFVFPRVILAPYLLVKENLGVTDSVQRSWDITKGHATKVWGIIGAHIVFGILCLVLIGIYFLFMYQAVFAILAVYILNKQKAAKKVAAPAS